MAISKVIKSRKILGRVPAIGRVSTIPFLSETKRSGDELIILILLNSSGIFPDTDILTVLGREIKPALSAD